MITYTNEQIHKARAKDELLRRGDAGQDAAQVIAEQGLEVKLCSQWKVRQAYRQRGWEGLVDQRCEHARKAIAEWLDCWAPGSDRIYPRRTPGFSAAQPGPGCLPACHERRVIMPDGRPLRMRISNPPHSSF